MRRSVSRIACHTPWRSILPDLPNLLSLAGYIVPVGGGNRNMSIECGYALARIVTLYQERFGRSFDDENHQYAPTLPHRSLGSVHTISTVLIMVSAVQVVLEKLAARRSTKSRMRLIMVLETMKVVLKLAYLFQTRQMLLNSGKTVTDEHCTVDNSKYRYRYYKGKRSGVRFAIPQNISNGANATEGTTEDTISTTIPNSFACLSSMWWLMFGEVLYIVRPALYAQLMSRRDQVLPIFVSVLLDLCSRVCTCQAMKKSQYQETNWVPFPNEIEELRTRKMHWMFYMLRNPIFSATIDPAANCIVENVKWIPLLNWASSWAYDLLKYYSAHHFYTSAS